MFPHASLCHFEKLLSRMAASEFDATANCPVQAGFAERKNQQNKIACRHILGPCVTQCRIVATDASTRKQHALQFCRRSKVFRNPHHSVGSGCNRSGRKSAHGAIKDPSKT